MKEEPALGMIEYKSVAQGIRSADAIVKMAPVTIFRSHTISPGKYINLFAGEVADVEESFRAGVEASNDGVINKVFIPFLHRDLVPALQGKLKKPPLDSLAILESLSVCSCVEAVDKALKAAPVKLVELQLGQGLGGKGYFILTGDLTDLEASLEVAQTYLSEDGTLAGVEIIPAPHTEMIDSTISENRGAIL
mgnify:CR=1 FL=1